MYVCNIRSTFLFSLLLSVSRFIVVYEAHFVANPHRKPTLLTARDDVRLEWTIHDWVIISLSVPLSAIDLDKIITTYLRTLHSLVWLYTWLYLRTQQHLQVIFELITNYFCHFLLHTYVRCDRLVIQRSTSNYPALENLRPNIRLEFHSIIIFEVK